MLTQLRYSTLVFILCIAATFLTPNLTASIAITGANGKVVEFAGIVSASPKGLLVCTQAGSDWITIPWQQIKFGELKAKHPVIHQAYVESNKTRNAVSLKLGIFSGKLLFDEAVESVSKVLHAPQAILLPGPVMSFALSVDMPMGGISTSSQ